MRKNVASQVICAQLNSKTDGSAVTSGTTNVYITGDGGTQESGSGTVTHEGQGCWSYVPTQAETNYNHVAFTFVNTTAVSQTVQAYPVAYDPTDSVRLGLTALPNVAAAANGGLPTVDASNAVKVQSGTGANQISLSSGLVTVGTNNDKTGYALTSGERTSIAEALLKLDLSTVTGEAARSVLNAVRFLRNKWSLSGSTLTVTKEDDSTSAWTSTITTDAAAEPITASDPS